MERVEPELVENNLDVIPKVVVPCGDDGNNEEEMECGEAEALSDAASSGTTEDKLSENEGVPKCGGGVERVLEGGLEPAKGICNPRVLALLNTTAGSLCDELRSDQHGVKNFTDLDIICCDGYIQVHRCLLMGASEFLRDLLIEKDIQDSTAITLPDVSVHHLSLVLSLLYSGKTVISNEDEKPVFEIMVMLGLPVSDIQCRSTKGNNIKQSIAVRCVLDSDLVDETEGNTDTIDDSNCKRNDEKEPTDTLRSSNAEHNEIGDVKVAVNDQGGDAATPNTTVSVESHLIHPVAENFKCMECGSVQLSEQELFNHLETFERCSKGVPKWISYEQRKCRVCDYNIPNDGPLQTLFDHVSMCMEKSPTFYREKEVQRNDVTLKPEFDLESKQLDHSPHSVPLAGSSSADVEDKSFEEACVGLEKQMAKQKKNSKNYKRKRNIIADYSEEVDNRSISSSSSSRTSSRKSGKRRKVSGSSTCSDPFDPLLDSLGTADRIDADVIRKEFSINTQMDIHNLSIDDLRVVLHKCPGCNITHPKMKTAARCLRHHGHRICWACLKVFPVHGPEFDVHAKTEHLGNSEGKVTCPLCLKEFDFNIGLPTHIGNYHYRRIMETQKETLNVVDLYCTEELAPENIIARPAEGTQSEAVVDDKKVFINEVKSEELLGETSSTATSPAAPQLQVTPSEIKVCADNLENGILSNNENSSLNSLTPLSSKAGKSMNELHEMAISCQICNTAYLFTECATKCLKSHGFKRCWACMLPFPAMDISEHIKSTHVMPGSPNMVECFVCMNPYAYDKGLNLHIGKHLAGYEREMGLKSVKTKKSASKIKQNDQPVENELNNADAIPLELEGNFPPISQSNKKKSLKSEKIIGPKKRGRKRKTPLLDPVVNSISEVVGSGALELSTDKVPESSGRKENQLLIENQKAADSAAEHEIKSDSENVGGTNQIDLVEIKVDADERSEWRIANTITAPTNKVFIEVREMNGTKYKIYGLMDPINGVQSGKTIAIELNSDEELQSAKKPLT